MWQNNYDNKLVWRWEIGINDVWHKIINYYPSSQSLLNNSYKSKIKVWDRETSSQNFFALKKRPWFNKVKFYSWNSGETNLVEDNMSWREVTDEEVLDSYRYLFVVTKQRDKMRIYKQIWITPDTCWNVSDDDVSVWKFVNISKYEYTWDWSTQTINHFPFSKCVYDKFVMCDWVKWKVVGQWDCSLKTEVVWNEIVHSFDSDSNIWWWSWDYVFIYDWTYWWQVADVLTNWWSTAVIWWWRAGLYNVGVPKQTNKTGANIDVMEITTVVEWSMSEIASGHKYKVFNNYWPILNFATADGIFHLHYDEWKPSTLNITYNKYTYGVTNDWESPSLKTVTWLCHFDSNIVFLEKWKWMITAGLYWYNKFMFTSLNSKELWSDYTHIINFQWYMLLLWPSHTAVFNTIYRGDWILDFAYYVLSEKKGYFSKDSFDVDDGSLVMFTNTNKLYTLSLEHTGNVSSDSDLSVWYSFNPVRSYQYHEFVWEMMNLNRATDDVSISYEDWDMKICVSPKYKDWQCVGTKIIMSDLQMKFWYQWFIKWMKVYWKKHNVWYWESVFNLEWDKDDWQYYQTLAWMFFWEQTLFSPKKIDYIRMAIWSDSYITNYNTRWNIDILMEDWAQNFVYDQLWTTSYVQYIMKAKDHGDWEIMFDLPIDIEVLWGNWVWLDLSMSATLENEMNEFFNYLPAWRWDSNIPNDVKVNKFGILEAGVWMICSSVYSEVVTTWSDSIELLWMFISSDYIEWYATKPDNTVIVKDRSFSWPSWKTLTNGSLSWKK